jgi:hypothetical protein
MYVLKTERSFTLGPAGPGHVREKQNIFRRSSGLHRAAAACSSCGKNEASSSRGSGAETTKPDREGHARGFCFSRAEG